MLGTRGVRGSVFFIQGRARRGRRKIFLGWVGGAGAKSSEWGGPGRGSLEKFRGRGSYIPQGWGGVGHAPLLGTCSNFAAQRVLSTEYLFSVSLVSPVNLFFIFVLGLQDTCTARS